MSLTDKLKKFANSPKGRELLDRGRHELGKPENQRKLKSLMNKLGGKRY